jgi:hypothetical protein
VHVLSKDRAETLAPHRPIDHVIDLEPGFKIPYGRIYNLSEVELKTLKAYIETNLANGFIQRSSSPAAAPMLFAKKKDSGLQLCVDYRALNRATVKNRYPVPLISEMLDRLRRARIFTKLDFRNAYLPIRIKAGEEYKTAFCTGYGQFKSQVMLFGLTNPLPTFQAYIDDCLGAFIDDCAVCYLNDILIYLTDQEAHEEQGRKVLERLPDFGFYPNAETCHFGVTVVGFLGFVVSAGEIGIEIDRISMIEDRTTPEWVRDVQVLFGFKNFYRRFFRKYAKVTTSVSDLLKKPKTSRTPKKHKWEWTRDAELSFRKVKRAFTDSPILNHFDPAKPIILQTVASGFAIAGILNQYDGFGIFRPVNFISLQSTGAEQKYQTYHHELLGIVETMKQWRH